MTSGNQNINDSGGFVIPGNLAKFFDFDPNLHHIDFEMVRDSDENYDDWFNTIDGDHVDFLFQFGCDGAGGIFALWNPKGLSSRGELPVVYLGSEGEIAVAAENIDEFLKLCAFDFLLYDLIVDGEEVHYSEIMDEDLVEEIKTVQKKYRDWLRNIGIEPVDSYNGILEKGSELLEQFEEWVENRLEA